MPCHSTSPRIYSVVNEPGRGARDSVDATDRPSLDIEERSLASLIHLLLSSIQAPRFARPRAPACGGRNRRQVVELTGIEPVPSWLQTRRSPR